MHYSDLTPYMYLTKSRQSLIDTGPQPLNVGWIEVGQPYTRGEVSSEFLTGLWQLGLTPINLLRGFHECDFCSDPTSAYLNVQKGTEELGMGNGEIWVFGNDNTVYVAPTLVYHYITHHSYLPPEAFLQAVLTAPLPDTPEYDLLAGQFRWGKNMLRDKEYARQHAQNNS